MSLRRKALDSKPCFIRAHRCTVAYIDPPGGANIEPGVQYRNRQFNIGNKHFSDYIAHSKPGDIEKQLGIIPL